MESVHDGRGSDGRIKWVDVAKGLGIILVVVGHSIRGLVHAHILLETPSVQAVDTWIYSFHMPLFFFLTGLFITRSAQERSLAQFFSDKVATLAYPYFVWSIIAILLKTILGQLPTTPRSLGDLPLIFYQPIEQYWFLYTLFVLSIGFKLLYSRRMTFWAPLAAAIALHPDLAPVLFDGSVLSEVRQFAVYFAIGGAIGSTHLNDIPKLSQKTLMITGPACLILAAGRLPFSPDELYPIFALLGAFGACATAVLISRGVLVRPFALLGRYSLEIYVAHTIASAGTRIFLILCHVTNPSIHLAAGVATGLLSPIALAIVLKKIGFKYGFSLKNERLRSRSWASV